MTEPAREDDPCKELLKRFEMGRFGEMVEQDMSEIVTVMAIVVLYVVCVALSVAVDLTTAIETLPTLTMISFHKREAVKTLAARVPPAVRTAARKVPPARKGRGNAAH
jgi:hypothetical protein